LLAARRLDGGRQSSPGRSDFGFSKSPEETLRFWDGDTVLSDTGAGLPPVQPDVVITRFPVDGRRTRTGITPLGAHGGRGDDAAGRRGAIPDQVAQFGTWRRSDCCGTPPKWFYDKPEEFQGPETLLAVDVGGFSPLLGESYPELRRAAAACTEPGFGSGGSRGEVLEYLQHVDGDRTTSELFDGIDTTWGRVKVANRSAICLSAPTVTSVRRAGGDRPDAPGRRARSCETAAGRWTTGKRADLDRIIAACLGLLLEAAAQDSRGGAGRRAQDRPRGVESLEGGRGCV